MDEAQFDKLVARWEERDRRWEERDVRWRESDREHREFMREMWVRAERMELQQQAVHEQVLGRLDALTNAVLRVVDRLDGAGPAPAG